MRECFLDCQALLNVRAQKAFYEIAHYGAKSLVCDASFSELSIRDLLVELIHPEKLRIETLRLGCILERMELTLSYLGRETCPPT